MTDNNEILRQPSEYDLKESAMARFVQSLRDDGLGEFQTYDDVHQWSVDNLSEFWQRMWDHAGIIHSEPYKSVLDSEAMPGSKWFTGAKLNFAENLLREAMHGNSKKIALTAFSEDRLRITMTYGQILEDVASLEAFLRKQGVREGDRVAGVVANSPEALIAMLATTSIGAIWSSASPDFGTGALLDRFGQIEPKVLIAVNGYTFNGGTQTRIKEIRELKAAMPSVQSVVMVQNVPDIPIPDAFVSWEEALSQDPLGGPTFTQLPFDHPVYIMYSSGTTGVPKCIVHSAGGTLLQHYKELVLHGDVSRDDTLFYHTTCGWMMWNWQASALMLGARVIFYDGAPKYPDLSLLWRITEQEDVTHFGTSARFIGACRNDHIYPNQEFQLSQLRVLFSTASPLLPADFDWVYEHVKSDVLLASISGGTDIISCFVGGNPMLPVRRGEIQCKGLGIDTKAFNDDGKEVTEECGELVCTRPIPSMPVYFWNDAENKKYHETYFEKYPGVWAHGDYVTFYEHGGSIIHGRSDATLNPNGVRIGTAEIYRVVENFDQVADSLVVEQPWQGDNRIVLFVVLNDAFELTDELKSAIKEGIRNVASPRHVPKKIIQVGEIPYTRSGKKVEIAVRKILRGDPVDNRGAIANQWALDQFVGLRELQAE